ncbi:hypothetical protein FOCC_FOCC014118, partial [Frankliniella occidentalis]
MNGCQQDDEHFWYESVCINNLKTVAKLDGGSSANIIPESTYEKMVPKPEMNSECNLVLKAFNNTLTKPAGVVHIEVCARNVVIKRDFVVVKGDVQVLLSKETSEALKLVQRIPVSAVQKVTPVPSTQVPPINDQEDKMPGDFNQKMPVEENAIKFVQENMDVFTGVGKVPQKASIKLSDKAEPNVFIPHRVPYHLQTRLKELLEKLCSLGIIKKVNEATEWVHNLVIAEKPNGDIRICLDPKEMNKFIVRLVHLIPTVEDVAVKINCKKYYSVLDFKDGFWQFELDDQSSKLCTFSSPFGCYRFTRMPFGISNAPELCQKINEENFGDIPGTCIVIDDLIVAADTLEEHDMIMQKVLKVIMYNLAVSHVPGKEMYVADLLSRQYLPISTPNSDSDIS